MTDKCVVKGLDGKTIDPKNLNAPGIGENIGKSLTVFEEEGYDLSEAMILINNPEGTPFILYYGEPNEVAILEKLSSAFIRIMVGGGDE